MSKKANESPLESLLKEIFSGKKQLFVRTSDW